MQRTSAHKISSQLQPPTKYRTSSYSKHTAKFGKNSSLLYLQFWYVHTDIKHRILKEGISTVFPTKKSNVITTASQSSSTFQLSIEKQNQSNHNYQSEQKLTMIISQWELKVETGNLLWPSRDWF